MGVKVANYLANDGKEWVFKEVEVQHIKEQLQKIKEEIQEKGMVGSQIRDRPKRNWEKWQLQYQGCHKNATKKRRELE